MRSAITHIGFAAAMITLAIAPSMAKDGAGGKTDAKVKVSAGSLVAARQAAMTLTAANLGSLKAMIDSGADPQRMQFAASGIAKWAAALPGLFPKGSLIDGSRALPAVWSDWAGFAAESKKFDDAARGLQAAIKGGDRALIGTAFDAVRGTCKSCHDRFQAPGS